MAAKCIVGDSGVTSRPAADVDMRRMADLTKYPIHEGLVTRCSYATARMCCSAATSHATGWPGLLQLVSHLDVAGRHAQPPHLRVQLDRLAQADRGVCKSNSNYDSRHHIGTAGACSTMAHLNSIQITMTPRTPAPRRAARWQICSVCSSDCRCRMLRCMEGTCAVAGLGVRTGRLHPGGRRVGAAVQLEVQVRQPPVHLRCLLPCAVGSTRAA